jgi:hypothetical protein
VLLRKQLEHRECQCIGKRLQFPLSRERSRILWSRKSVECLLFALAEGKVGSIWLGNKVYMDRWLSLYIQEMEYIGYILFNEYNEMNINKSPGTGREVHS